MEGLAAKVRQRGLDDPARVRAAGPEIPGQAADPLADPLGHQQIEQAFVLRQADDACARLRGHAIEPWLVQSTVGQQREIGLHPGPGRRRRRQFHGRQDARARLGFEQDLLPIARSLVCQTRRKGRPCS